MVERGGSRNQPKGYLGATYDMLTSSENAAVVRSIGLFGVRYFIRRRDNIINMVQVAVTFLASSWGELLLPP
jgi:hypothetical protein